MLIGSETKRCQAFEKNDGEALTPGKYTYTEPPFFLQLQSSCDDAVLNVYSSPSTCKTKNTAIEVTLMILHHIFSYCCAQREHFCHLSLPAAAANNIMKCIALHCLLGIAVGKLVVFVPSNYEAIACLAHAF